MTAPRIFMEYVTATRSVRLVEHSAAGGDIGYLVSGHGAGLSNVFTEHLPSALMRYRAQLGTIEPRPGFGMYELPLPPMHADCADRDLRAVEAQLREAATAILWITERIGRDRLVRAWRAEIGRRHQDMLLEPLRQIVGALLELRAMGEQPPERTER